MFVAKTVMINVRLTEETRQEFQIACELRGASMAGLLHQFIVKTIREEKQKEPHSFEKEVVVYDKTQARLVKTELPSNLKKEAS